MTIKEFASKYDIPVQRVKAAMNLRKGGTGTARDYEISFPEQEMCEKVFCYLMNSIRCHIELASIDNDQAKRIAELNNEWRNDE